MTGYDIRIFRFVSLSVHDLHVEFLGMRSGAA